MEATALGIDTEELIKSDEELQAEQQQQTMMAMANRAAPQLAKGMVDNPQAVGEAMEEAQ